MADTTRADDCERVQTNNNNISSGKTGAKIVYGENFVALP